MAVLFIILAIIFNACLFECGHIIGAKIDGYEIISINILGLCSYRLNKKHLNEIMKGFVIGKENDKYLVRTYWNAPDDIDGKIYVTSNTPLSLGEEVTVKINETFVYDLFGEVNK